MQGAQPSWRNRAGKTVYGGSVNKIVRQTMAGCHRFRSHARLEQHDVFAGNGLGEHVNGQGQKEQTDSDP